MRPLRVGLDLTPLLGPPAGIHQVTRGLLDALEARDDIEVRGWLLSARGGRPEVTVPIRRSRVPARLAHLAWGHTPIRAGRLITGAVDVVHGTNFIAPPSPRSVISIQDLSPFTHPEWCRPEVAALTGPVRAAIRRGATIHASSRAIADEVGAMFDLEPARVAVVHHGVESLPAGDAAEGRALAGSERYVLVLGTVEPRKNVGAVIAAIDELPGDVTVVLAGPAAGTVPITDHPRLLRLPAVSQHEKASLLRGATVLAFASHYEGFGLPPLEALSVGTPVVATAVGALPELLGDVIALVPPGDDDAIADALLEAVERPQPVPREVTARVGALTWVDAAAALVEVYRRVADQTGGDPAAR